MLEIKNLSFRIAGNSIFSSASAYIPTGSKVGVVGRNGTGKTTLFKLIENEYAPDDGEINIKKNSVVSGVSQHVPNGPESLIGMVLKADLELTSLLAEEKVARNPDRISEIQERLFQIDGYSAEARASSILKGLGFSKLDEQRSCNEFSGGWQMRVALASVLFSAPDLLLLDEPTNYLDLEGSIWLESFLSKYPKTIILISHDRAILTKSVNKILHLENENLSLFTGNYDFFIKSYNEILKLEQSNFKKEEAKKAHIRSFVEKFRAKASKAKQAQSRLKALERMQSKPQFKTSKVNSFFIPSSKILAPPIINLCDITVGYNEKIILKDLNLRIDPEDRIALLGANGQGKSTFSKLLAGKLLPKRGTIIKSSKLKIGYFSQDLVESLSFEKTAYDHLAGHIPNSGKAKIISTLALGGITGSQVLIPVKSLSGGQKARLAILLATINAPHLLILDEPTNHLDIESREALATSLNLFSGAIILVSHDPYLIDLVATDLWLVKNNNVTRFESDLASYQKLLLTGDIRAKKNFQLKNSKVFRPTVTKDYNDGRSLGKQLEKAEERVKRLNIMKRLLDNHFTDPDIYLPINKKRLQTLKDKDKELNAAIELAENIWMEISQKIDSREK